MSVLLTTINDIRDDLSYENFFIWTMKKRLNRSGIINECVTPYNDLPQKNSAKTKLWHSLNKLSRRKGFSLLYIFLLGLKALEVSRQVRLLAPHFKYILAYDGVTAMAAVKATEYNKCVYLQSRFAGTPWREFLSLDQLKQDSLGYIIIKKIMERFYIKHQRQLLFSTTDDALVAEITSIYNQEEVWVTSA